MDAFHSLELLAALLLTALTVRGLWHVARQKPFVSVANARSLVFASGMFAAMLYFWVRFFKSSWL